MTILSNTYVCLHSVGFSVIDHLRVGSAYAQYRNKKKTQKKKCTVIRVEVLSLAPGVTIVPNWFLLIAYPLVISVISNYRDVFKIGPERSDHNNKYKFWHGR